jgi:hypothetical protein
LVPVGAAHHDGPVRAERRLAGPEPPVVDVEAEQRTGRRDLEDGGPPGFVALPEGLRERPRRNRRAPRLVSTFPGQGRSSKSFTARGIEESKKRRGEEEATFEWLAERCEGQEQGSRPGARGGAHRGRSLGDQVDKGSKSQ